MHVIINSGKYLTYPLVRRIASNICFDKEIFPSGIHKGPGRNSPTLFSYWRGCGSRLVDFVHRCSQSNSEPLRRDTPCQLTWHTYSSICNPSALGSCIAGAASRQSLEWHRLRRYPGCVIHGQTREGRYPLLDTGLREDNKEYFLLHLEGRES